MTNVAEQKQSSTFGIRYVAFIGMFAAIATVLMLIEVPLPFAPTFYKLDLSEVPVLIGGFALGPIAGILIELVKVLINLLINGTLTAGVGEFANFAIGCALVVPATLIYRAGKTRKNAIIGMVAGILVMAFIGAAFNGILLLPAYGKAFGMPIDALVGMGSAVNPLVTDLFTFCLFAVAPFNLVKGALTAVITMILYKHISRLIHTVMQ